MWKKKKTAVCPVSVLFEIMEEDLADGLCSDIQFVRKEKKHRIGVWGDNGNTFRNIHFYFDRQEYGSMEELRKAVLQEGEDPLLETESVTVRECNGCYPDSTSRLVRYLV